MPISVALIMSYCGASWCPILMMSLVTYVMCRRFVVEYHNDKYKVLKNNKKSRKRFIIIWILIVLVVFVLLLFTKNTEYYIYFPLFNTILLVFIVFELPMILDLILIKNNDYKCNLPGEKIIENYLNIIYSKKRKLKIISLIQIVIAIMMSVLIKKFHDNFPYLIDVILQYIKIILCLFTLLFSILLYTAFTIVYKEPEFNKPIVFIPDSKNPIKTSTMNCLLIIILCWVLIIM
ncbi:MAG: hypothetical protein ACI3ZZ_06620 [Candidatus Aphodosoma sp.]